MSNDFNIALNKAIKKKSFGQRFLHKTLYPEIDRQLLDDTFNQACEIIGSPQEIVKSSMLAAMSIACQQLIDVDSPGSGRTPVSLFLLTSADSGERKTATESLMFKPIFDFDRENRIKSEELLKDFKCELLIWKAKLANLEKEFSLAIKEKSPIEDLKAEFHQFLLTEPVIAKNPRYIYQDVTVRALQAGMADNWPSAALIASEAAGIFTSRHAESLPSLSAIWDGRPIDVQRANCPSIYVEDPRLTISLMQQPGVLQRMLGKHNGVARLSGVLARFLVVEPVSMQGSRQIHPAEIGVPKEDSSIKIFYSRLRQLLEISQKNPLGQRKLLRFSPPAQQLWLEFYNSVESELGQGGCFSDIRDCASKIAGNMSRIAALIHFFCGMPGDIDVESTQRARDICVNYLVHFKRLFGVLSHEEVVFANAMRLNSYLYDKSMLQLNHGVFGVAKSVNGQIYFEKSQLENSGPLRPKALLEDALMQLSFWNVVCHEKFDRKQVVLFNPQASQQVSQGYAI